MSKIKLNAASGGGSVAFEGPSSSGNDKIIKFPAAPGVIVQTVQTVKTDTYSGASNGSEITLTGITVTITPTSSTSKILLVCSLFYSCTGTTYKLYPKRGSTIIGVGDAAGSRIQAQGALGFAGDANQCEQCTTYYLDSPSTTSATTYSFYAKNDNTKDLFINRSEYDTNSNVGARGISTVTAMEVTA
mgnify:CR=1 FL=1|tara:strand:- start:270 stop:833 length:564 start_codon:yes stop_codon:yes gene_type:complete